MGSYEHGLRLAERLEDSGIAATCDPRSANPPCILITPPTGTVDHMCGATGAWTLFALSPTTANADAWKVLDAMLTDVMDVLPVEGWDFVAYSLSPDNPPIPSYRIRYTEAFDL